MRYVFTMEVPQIKHIILIVLGLLAVSSGCTRRLRNGYDWAKLQRMTNVPGVDAHSTWCAGGDWVVFSSARMGFKDEMALYDAVPQPYGEIFAMRADCSDVRQLTDNKWEDSGAVCRPD